MKYLAASFKFVMKYLVGGVNTLILNLVYFLVPQMH